MCSTPSATSTAHNANPCAACTRCPSRPLRAIAKVRQQIADLIGAAQAKSSSPATRAVAQFARLAPSPRAGRRGRHHHHGAPLNLIPWQQVCPDRCQLVYLYPPRPVSSPPRGLAKVGPKTKILAVGQVSNCWREPSQEPPSSSHKYGGYLVVDGARRCTCRSMWPTGRRLLCL
ncbi:MAG: hypothetical protein ACLU0O_02030 [Collinsella sp.]